MFVKETIDYGIICVWRAGKIHVNANAGTTKVTLNFKTDMYINVPENEQEEFHNRVQLAQAPLSSYKCPATAEDYWAVVDNYWSYLLAILERFGPPLKLDEMLSGSEILSVSVAATRWKEKRDIRLVEYFNDTWWAAPDCGTIHMIPGWHILCDLCSESCLVYEEEN